uniref:Uncharacterized protein n=1 Tax=Arundo donax TaxID=35708 RepID=A0A0A9ENL3_ARUDO
MTHENHMMKLVINLHY